MVTISKASGDRTAYESHRGARTQNQSEFFRSKPTRGKECRKKRRDQANALKSPL